MQFSKVIFRVVLPLAIVAGGGGVAFAMINSAQTAERSEPKVEPRLVSVFDPQVEDAVALIKGTGVVEPARRITLSPEVTGRIVELSDHLVLGGRIRAGERLVKIDARDYRLDVRARQSAVERARLDLEQEKGRGRVAEREWELLGKDASKREDAGRLVLRKPQLESAQVSVESAKIDLERARVQLSRTTIDAPFNATVVDESVEAGQLVQPGTQMATLIGTDRFWVRVSLPIEDLALIDVPGPGEQYQPGDDVPEARVIQRLGPQGTIVRTAKVVRLVGELDPETRRAQVLVEVENPLDPPDGKLPLLPGAFVEVEIEGHPLPNTTKIPRAAIIEGDEVLVADEGDELQRRTLVIRWADDTFAYAASGLEPGDRVITDKISPVIEGQPLRTKPAELAEVTDASTEAIPKNPTKAADAGPASSDDADAPEPSAPYRRD